MLTSHDELRQGRKQIRPRLRPELTITPQRQDQRDVYIVKDPVRLRYFNFSAQEHFLLERLDGSNTTDDLRRAFEQRYRPQRLPDEDLEIFLRQLIQAGLVGTEVSTASWPLLKRRRKHERRERLANWTNLLAFRIRLFDPDRLLSRLLSFVSWLFTPVFAGLCLLLMGAALLLVGMHCQEFVAKLPAAHEFFSIKMALYLWLTLGGVKVLHELGHGLTCKAFGGEVHETGLMFLCLAPCLYCEVSDSWTMPSKWRRMAIGAAGIFVELTIAAAATFVWWYTSPGSFLNQLSLCLIVVCSVNTLFFNGNPLLRYDGYFVLADLLEMPNLKQQSTRVVKQWLGNLTLGLKLRIKERLSPGRRLFLLTYGIASSLYMVAVTAGVFLFIHGFLKPHKLQALTWVLATIVLGTAAGRWFSRCKKTLREQGRLPDMKASRIVLTALALAGLAACFFLVPLPLSRVRQTGLVQVAPQAVSLVFAKTPGTLLKMHVTNGTRVQRGDLLAEFRNVELENQHAESLTERDVSRVELLSVRERLAAVPEEQRAELEIRLSSLQGEQERFTREVRHFEQLLQTLQVRAPRDGVVFGLPDLECLGRWWHPDKSGPLCRIGDPGELRVVVPVTPDDYQRLQEDMALARGQGSDLEVSLRFPGHAGKTWQARVAELPESEVQDVPLALTQQAGGPLHVRPGRTKNTFIPTQQHYLIGVSFREPPGTICPGALATVLIRCQWRPASWWLWHTLAGMFDLGLL